MAEKKTLKFPNGSAWVCVSDGVVTHDKKWSETHVSSTGGGATVINNTVYVDPVTVRSSASEQMEFWIQEDDGSETSIRFSDVDFAVRPGQRVRVAWGTSMRRERGGYLYAHNYASKESVSMVSNWYDWARKQGLTNSPFLYRLMTTWLSLALALFVGMVWAAMYTGGRYDLAQARPVQQDIQSMFAQAQQREGITNLVSLPQLTRLGMDTLGFASVGLSQINTLWSKQKESLSSQAALLGVGIGLAVWIPLVLVFHILGTLTFHMWWRFAQHKIIASRMQPLFRV